MNEETKAVESNEVNDMKDKIYEFIDMVNKWKNSIENQNVDENDIENNRAYIIMLCEFIIANHCHSPSIMSYDRAHRFPLTIDDDDDIFINCDWFDSNNSKVHDLWISSGMTTKMIKSMRYTCGPHIFYIGESLITIFNLIENYLRDCKNIDNPFDEFKKYIDEKYPEKTFYAMQELIDTKYHEEQKEARKQAYNGVENIADYLDVEEITKIFNIKFGRK